jgi:hypothetical protein
LPRLLDEVQDADPARSQPSVFVVVLVDPVGPTATRDQLARAAWTSLEITAEMMEPTGLRPAVATLMTKRGFAGGLRDVQARDGAGDHEALDLARALEDRVAHGAS